MGFMGRKRLSSNKKLRQRYISVPADYFAIEESTFTTEQTRIIDSALRNEYIDKVKKLSGKDLKRVLYGTRIVTIDEEIQKLDEKRELSNKKYDDDIRHLTTEKNFIVEKMKEMKK